jgi:micrococcal nuclease
VNIPAAGPAANIPAAGPADPIAPAATDTAAADPAGIKLQSLTSPISRGLDAKLTVRTAPGALCTIQVRYRSGPSKARGLEPKTAGESGLAEWRWHVGRQTRAGEWPIDVACTANNLTSRLATSIVVTDQ